MTSMKNIILILFAFSFIATSFSLKEENFEGVIVYEHKYESSNPKMNLKAIEKAYGTKSEYYYKNGNFRQSFNGEELKMNLYILNQNKIYMNTVNDTLYFDLCDKPNEIVISLENDSIKEKILGYECKILYLKSNKLSGKYYRNAKYYYNEKIKINPTLSKNQINGSYNLIYEKTKSLPLKIVNDLGSLKITMTAIEIRKQKLDNSFFELAKDALLAPLRK